MRNSERVKVKNLLESGTVGAEVAAMGWVRTKRGNKSITFIALNDGSTINSIQVVFDMAVFSEDQLKNVATGACIGVRGKLVESPGSGQRVEIQASYLEVLTAQKSLLGAQLSKVSDDFYRMQAVVNLYYALGGGR